MINFVTPQQPADDFHKLFLTVREVSHVLGIKENTIRNRIYLGTWPVAHVKIGNKILFPLEAHQKFVDELLAQTQRPVPAAKTAPRAGCRRREVV